MKLTVRECQLADIENIVDYFVDADADFLKGMGADKTKLPSRAQWIKTIQSELDQPHHKRNYYYIIWLCDREAVGHSNVNQIIYGDSATMHLHLWKSPRRQAGLGTYFLKLSIPFYFEKLNDF